MKSAEIKLITEILGNNGEVRFIGGCVRDAIIGLKIKDIDIATTIPPKKVMAILDYEGIKVKPTGIRFGTVTAIINKQKFEITTLRSDISCDGRHAEVEYTEDWQKDALRRDFTINALSMDMEGNIYDYFGGIEDLKKGIIRFVGDPETRIKEDYLRVLRLFRFHCYYGKKQIDENTLSICNKLASGMNVLSGERIKSEMFKIISAPDPSYVLEEMSKNGILTEIIDGYKTDTSLITSLINLEKTNKGLARKDPYVRLLCIVGQDITIEDIKKLQKRWKLSNLEKKYLIDISYAFSLSDNIFNSEIQKKTMREFGKKTYTLMIPIIWAKLSLGKETNKRYVQEFSKIFKLLRSWEIPKFPLKGDDIIHLGIAEGEKIGALLKKSEDYWEKMNYKPGKMELIEFITQNSK